MGDLDHAIDAREALQAIGADARDNPEFEATRDRALDAVDDLVKHLQEAEVQSEPSTRQPTETPDEWEDNDELDDALDDAYANAAIPRSKGTITKKTISDNEYYYLQWREGDKVKSQYIAPASPE